MINLIISLALGVAGYVLLAYVAYHHGYDNGLSDGYDMVRDCIQKGVVIEHRTSKKEKA